MAKYHLDMKGFVQWGTNQNVVFEIAARKLSRLPTLKAFQELKNWYFPTMFYQRIIFKLIICVPNFKAKRSTDKKLFKICQHW